MGNSFKRLIMEEEQNPINTSEALMITRKDTKFSHLQTPSSYSITITIPQPRLKIPKFSIKTIPKMSHESTSSNSNDYPFENKKKLAKPRKVLKFGFIFTNVFGNKRSSSSSEKSHKGCKRSNGSSHSKEIKSEDYLSSQLRKVHHKVDLKVRTCISGLFNKRKVLNLFKKNMMDKNSEKDSKYEDDRDSKEEEEGSGEELSKKRILMGEKCRPIEFSGTLTG